MLLALNVCIGTVNISVSEVIDVLLKRDAHAIYTDIIMQIRLPRTLASFILGAALALSGYLLQTFFNNPIAGPFILGISSGAKMVVALFMVYALEIGLKMTSITMILAAFAGAMLSILFVLIISRAVDNMGMLIVAGVMIGYICSAVTDFLVTFADDSNIVNLHNWSLGSFSGITWENVYVMAVVVFICFCCVFLMSKSIAAYLLGEAYASNMGVNIRRFRIYLVVLSGILSACVTAFAGPISFVGIAVPHLVKRLFKNTKPIIMIPACSLGGGIFCLFCDLLSRIIFAPTELSVSTITAILGAPVVIYIMVRRKKEV
ncbi:MAG: iron ABC transporter permease [Agathobacter sp.]|nr:iron ABC transporter permease [Agathobacter sp.]MDY3795328.1 iron ABC transporter permease [Agathobacter sp.]